MNLPYYIAKRYLFAKKSHNAINIISYISAGGVAVGTMALIIVLSVFNGFDNVVQSLFNSFNPDLIVTIKEGKTFTPDEVKLKKLKNTPGIVDYAEVLEDRALIRYNEKPATAVIKGVSSNYTFISGIDSMVRQGIFLLEKDSNYYSVVGQGIAYLLDVNLDVRIGYRPPLAVYVPNRKRSNFTSPERDINRRYITPVGIFGIEQEFDSKYVFVPIEFARDLFGYDKEVSSIEIKTGKIITPKSVQRSVEELFGPDYQVKNRYQQNELFFKTMKAEKWAIFLILIFILIIASFNVIGSLTMLILEKKQDISVLLSMGADIQLIKRIFQTEGWLISVLGAISGLILGLIVCWLQIKFKIIKLQGSGSFVIDAYPVDVQTTDIFAIFIAVLIIAYFAAWYPIRYVMKKSVTSGDTIVY